MNKILLLTVLVTLAACQPHESSEQETDHSPYLKINLENLRVCSMDSPCENEESCISYDSSGKSHCYPEGREDEVVGCRRGKLIVLASYPGKVDCLEEQP